jgi:UDP-N-acetyl-2-amino-2-deoxyglucuronate dehydrogenase
LDVGGPPRLAARMTSASSAPLGFGIIGLGMIAEYHARALAEVEGARLVAVATRRPDHGRAFAAQHGVEYAGPGVDALVARPDVNVICITTSAGAHLEPALLAVRGGKHVVVEKPLEITVERTDALLAAAATAGVRVAAIFQSRFGDGARTVKAAVDAGRLGRLVLASAAVKWHRTASYYTGSRGSRTVDGGGALLNQGIHAVDLLQWFAGLPEEVSCWTTRRVHLGIESEDTATASLRFPHGALGTIEASTAVWPGWQRRVELCGDGGSIALEDDQIVRWDFREAQPGDEAIRERGHTAALGSGASAPNAISVTGHQRQLQDFVHSLRANRPPLVEGSEARKAVALVCALYASAAAQGRPVRL